MLVPVVHCCQHMIKKRYDDLSGYADDILEIIHALNLQNVIFIGHSVSAMMGIIAAVKEPALFKHLVLVGPSPSYINDGDYIGGFTKPQIDELLESMDNNHLGWSMSMAPVIMANPERKDLAKNWPIVFAVLTRISRSILPAQHSDGRTGIS